MNNEQKEAIKENLQNVQIISPWIDFYRKVEALFAMDPDVQVKWNNEESTLYIYVTGTDKAEAIQALLGTERTFGNLYAYISVIPSNDSKPSMVDYLRRAFAGNPALVDVVTLASDLPTIGGWTYAVFKGKVVQYHNDDISDVNLLRSTLYQELAKEVIGEQPGVYFCTEKVIK